MIIQIEEFKTLDLKYHDTIQLNYFPLLIGQYSVLEHLDQKNQKDQKQKSLFFL